MGKKDFCCVPCCSHDRSKGSGCSFHRVPTKPEWLRNAWIVKINRVQYVKRRVVSWTPNDSSRVCSCHFKEGPPSRWVNKYAVPTIFQHTGKTKKSERPAISYRNREYIGIVKNSPNETEKQVHETVTLVTTDDVEQYDTVSNCSEYDRDMVTTNVLECHDYVKTTVDQASFKLLEDNPDLKQTIKEKETSETKCEMFDKMNATGQILSLKNIQKNVELFQYYTGLPNYAVFEALLTYLSGKAKDMKYAYGDRTVLHEHFANNNTKKPGRKRSTTLEDEFFMTLVRLRLGVPAQDCAIRFGLAPSTFSSNFTAWVSLLAIEMEKICKMPPTEVDHSELQEADCFKEFPNLKIVVDCTELFSETPSSLSAHKQFHSNYKHHSTIKFLVGMNAGGAITYISDMFGGRASDKHITSESVDLLSNIHAGEKIMADRGFTIHSELSPGVKLVIPAFKHKDKSQFAKKELQENKKISEARVYIERAIRRIKQWQILAKEMKLCQINIYNNIFKACAYLVNFQDPFLKVV